MKFNLSDREQRQLNTAVERNPMRRFLLKKDEISFEVGDVLIKNIRRYKGSDVYEWSPEPISSENKMPQRYVCVFKDEFGIAYLKQLKVSTGSLGKDIYVISDYDLNSISFQVDPEYAETTFLDGDFNIKDMHKKSLEARKIVTKMNRKIGIKFKSLEDGNKFFNGMKSGDKFWITSDFTAKWCEQCEIISMHAVTIHSLESSGDWNWRRYRDRLTSTQLPQIINAHHTFKIKYKASSDGITSRDREILIFDMGKDMVFYKSAPAREEGK